MTTIPLPAGTVLAIDGKPEAATPVFAHHDDAYLVGDFTGSAFWRQRRKDEVLDHFTRLPAPLRAVVPHVWFEDGAMHVRWKPVQYVLISGNTGERYSVTFSTDGIPDYHRLDFLTAEQAADPAFRDYAILSALWCDDPLPGTEEEREAAIALVERSIDMQHSRPYFTAAALASVTKEASA